MPECNPKDCPLTPRVEALEKENKRHTDTHKEIFGRLNKVELDNAVQSEQYKTILEKLEAHDKKQDAMNEKLQSIEAKPAKRWETIAMEVIKYAVLLLVGIAAGKAGIL